MHVLPVLYSFAKNKFCSVDSQFHNGGWDIQLHPNLSQMASQELLVLNGFLADLVPTSNREDKRVSSVHRKEITTSYYYHLLTFRGVTISGSGMLLFP